MEQVIRQKVIAESKRLKDEEKSKHHNKYAIELDDKKKSAVRATP